MHNLSLNLESFFFYFQVQNEIVYIQNGDVSKRNCLNLTTKAGYQFPICLLDFEAVLFIFNI